MTYVRKRQLRRTKAAPPGSNGFAVLMAVNMFHLVILHS